MKVICIGPAYPLRGGIARFNESFSFALEKKEIDVEIFSFRYLYPRFLFPGKTQFCFDTPKTGLKIRSILNPLNPLNWRNVAQSIISSNPDMIVFHYWMPFFALLYRKMASIIRKKTGVPVIVIAHNLIPHEKQAFSLFLARSFFQQTDGVVTLSARVLRDMDSLVPGKKAISLFHPVYDSFGEKVSRLRALEELGLENTYRYLLFFGLVRDYKGLDILLQALVKVTSEDYKLLIAGEFYENKNKYTDKIAETGLKDKVIIRDEYIPDEEVKYYFSLADLVIQPYRKASQSGITQIAYHFDCPTLVTKAGGLPEAVIHNKTGYVVDAEASALAAGIDDFLLHRNKDEFVASVSREKKRFSWDSFTERFLEFAKSL